jgi:fluoroquinolone transport system permease protein
MYTTVILGVVLIALVGHFGLPLLVDVMAPLLPLGPYLPLIHGVFLLLPSLLFGMVAGFLLLDERDEGVLHYWDVTPVGTQGYLGYRVVVSVGASGGATAIVAALLPLPALPAAALVGLIIAAALQAAVVLLFLGSFARNKVEGLAYSKAFGLLIAAPIAAYFIPGSWGLLLGVVPTVWLTEALVAHAGPQRLLWPAVAIVMTGALIELLRRRVLAGRRAGSTS